MDKEEFKQWIISNYNLPNDNRTLAPNMLNGVLEYAESLDEKEMHDFFRTVFPDFPEMIIRRVFY